MKLKKNQLSALALALCAVLLGSEGAALAQTSRQKDKNDMRNLGVGLGALAIHKSIKGDPKQRFFWEQVPPTRVRSMRISARRRPSTGAAIVTEMVGKSATG